MAGDVKHWLEALGCGAYAEVFQENHVDFALLPSLTADDLKDMGVASVGHRRRLLNAIAALCQDGADGEPSNRSATAPQSPDLPASAPSTALPPSSPPSSVPSGSVSTLEDPPSTWSTARQAERRHLTVMFCDLVGSTALSQSLDPEDMREIIRQYQTMVAQSVFRFEGHVAKFMGDGVMAFFGYPQAHENDAERAIRSACSIVAAMKSLALGDGTALHVRVGIATGEVVVGDLVGEGAAQEEAIVGDAPNLAARLQSAAQPGEIIVGAGTRRLAGDAFDFSDHGRQSLKGFRDPVQLWLVVGEKTLRRRLETRPGHWGALIGRQHEVGMLLERWQRAKDGEGLVVMLGGEAGIGKSRILEAVHDELAAEQPTLLRYQCSPYHVNSPLYPVISQLEWAAGFTAQDSDREKLAKLETLLAPIPDAPPSALRLLADLLSIGADGPDALGVTPQETRAMTIDLLVRQVRALAQRRAVLILFEDAHWIDPTTKELLDILVDGIADQQVLALITHRPEFHIPWTGHAHVNVLPLGRLSRSQCRQIVQGLEAERLLSGELVDRIVEKADGIPLFVEELYKTVLESQTQHRRREPHEPTGPGLPAIIPDTLQDSLMARLDRLGWIKEVAQVAAVIGREFSGGLLARVAARAPQDVDAAIEKLMEADLVLRQSSRLEVEYRFKHALVRDAAYHSLLKATRQQLHAKVGQLLLEQAPSLAETEPELLAFHFTEAGNVQKAIDYWQRAGERAVLQSANAEAEGHLGNALDLMKRIARDRPLAERELHLLTLMGPAQMVVRGQASKEVEATLQRAMNVAQEIDSLDHIVSATLGFWLMKLNRGEFKGADELTDDLFRLAHRATDDGLLLQAHHAAWTVKMFKADFLGACHDVRAGLDLYDPDRHGEHRFVHLWHDPSVCGHAIGSIAHWMAGYQDQALVHLNTAVESADRQGHVPTLAHALSYAGYLHVLRRDPQAALAVAERLLEIATTMHMSSAIKAAHSIIGWAKVAMGETRCDIGRLEQAVDQMTANEGWVHMPQRLAMLADALSMTDHLDQALARNAKALTMMEASDENWYKAVLILQRGELLISSGADMAAAEAMFRQCLLIAQAQKAKTIELRAATRLAWLWGERGERAQAVDLLKPLHDGFPDSQGSNELREAGRLLSDL